MTPRRITSLLCGLLPILSAIGCLETNRPLHYLGEQGVDYYKEQAQTIDYPHVHEEIPDEVRLTQQPRTIHDRKQDQIREMSLVEAIHLALANNRVVQSGNLTGINARTVLTNPDRLASIYDPAIQESGVLFGGRGLESALAAFDTQFSTSMIWGRNESIPNVAFFGPGGIPGATLQGDSGAFLAQLQKTFAHGGLLSLEHNWDYSSSNAQSRLFPSSYSGSLGARYRQPLLAGAGTGFTRTAGPILQSFGGLSGVNQGVVIARINNDISIADFEMAVRNGLRLVETTYWDLYLAYQQYHTAIVARNSARQTWEEADKIKKAGGGREGFQLWEVQQALEQFHENSALADMALNQIFSTEANLRELMGLPLNDGTMIRPSDKPADAELEPDWNLSLAEALTRRVELRKQKWKIKSLELQLKAARSLTRPRLDFVAGYRINAFGDHLFNRGDNDVAMTAQGIDSAYETLSQGDQTGWSLGIEMNMPLGFRSAHAQVRNVELRLAKERDVLAVQERSISHELAGTFRSLALHYQNARSQLSRRKAAQERLRQFAIRKKLGDKGFTLDDVLRAQTSVAQAEVDYFTSLVNYTKSITDMHFAKGTLLEHDNVFLAEGGWTPEAYQDALRRALARSHAFDNDLLHAEPREFVLPAETEFELMPSLVTPAEPPDPDSADADFTMESNLILPSLSTEFSECSNTTGERGALASPMVV
ncbi:MAG: TolC family protein, partial [Planctomycetes bacterium]|nr:TolC family protein [Planctomycetota bacterium]